MNRLLLILLLIAATATQSAFADKGDRWRVSDQDLSVWSSPDYLEKLGTIHQGYEITETGLDGDMIQFSYNGQTAYVASYCCERIANEVATQETAQKAATAAQPRNTAKAKKTAQPTIEIASRTEKEQKEDVSAGAIALSVPLLLISLVSICISLVAIVFTIFYVFKYKTLAAWFNKKCEAEVIPYKRMNSLLWAPIIAALAMAILGGGINYLITLGADENSNLTVLLILGIVLTLAIPFFVLRHVYVKNKRQYGKKAARWMMVYSLLSITAIYLCCVVVAYIVVGILALLLFILIICLCFPTRYYIVRRWW